MINIDIMKHKHADTEHDTNTTQALKCWYEW